MAEQRTNADPLGLEGATIEGRYQLEQAVGAGGFGVVYRGVQLRLGRRVAVKVLRRPLGASDGRWADTLRLFEAEARIIAAVRHPNVVQVIDHGIADFGDGTPAPWIALEWVEGQTLQAWLDARGRRPMAPEDAWRFLRPVVDAAACFHRRRIAHRDIKPANIMVALDDGVPSLRLLDLGVAKILEADEATPSTGATATRGSTGGFSPRYAAPEQVGGLRTGPWTDVHALGMLLTELITGRRPYQGETLEHQFAEAFSPLRPTPAKLGVDAGAWEAPLARCVALLVAERYADAGAMMAALDAVATTEAPPREAPTSDASRSVAGDGRTRGIPAAVALLALLALSAVWGARLLLRVQGTSARAVTAPGPSAHHAPTVAVDGGAAPDASWVTSPADAHAPQEVSEAGVADAGPAPSSRTPSEGRAPRPRVRDTAPRTTAPASPALPDPTLPL